MSLEFDSPTPYSEEWWRVTLSSIGDAVIVTNLEGKVAFMNLVAQSLTGWENGEAKGRSLEEVFTIVDEVSRARLENPVSKVLRTGAVVELSNHTMLLAKSGFEIPVDDSAAPIRDSQGNIFGVVLVFRDISERRQAEATMRRLAAIVTSSDDAIVGKTLEGVITNWNRGAERIFGYTEEEAIGQRIYMIIPPERHKEEEQILAKLKRGERTEHFETVRVRKDGRRIDVSLSISPIMDDNGRIIGASKIARDITERRLLEEERQQLLEREQAARAKAEEANRLKDDFLATVSHELRTPLNAILGWAKMLRGGKLDASAALRAIETIERSAQAQAQLITDLLDISRIISGRLRLNVSTIELAPIIEMAVETVRPAAEAKGVRLQNILDTTVGPVSGDPERLQQVVWNLLSNAVKFTPKGGRAQVRLERMNSHVEIIVSDTGEGIKKEFLPHVFDRFRQADSSLTRSHSGLGLGLAIVRHLVELHGGTVRAESLGEGLGAAFTVRLPVALSQRVDALLDQTSIEGPSFEAKVDLSGIMVLVIDDEPDARELLSHMLEGYGAQVRSAGTASQALDLLEEVQPNVLVSDIGMPEESGYDLIKKVRGRGIQIPAIALTAYARTDDRLQALSAGFQIHIAKPVDPVELAVVVASLAGLVGRR